MGAAERARVRHVRGLRDGALLPLRHARKKAVVRAGTLRRHVGLLLHGDPDFARPGRVPAAGSDQGLLPAPGPHVIGLRVHVGVLEVRDGRAECAVDSSRHASRELVPLRAALPRVLRALREVRLRAGDGAPHFECGLPAPEARLRPRRAVPRAGLRGLTMMISLSPPTLYLLVIIALM